MELLTALFGGVSTFLGSATLRWVLGEAFAFFKAKQEYKFEEARLSNEHSRENQRREWRKDELAHARGLEIKLVEVQAEAARQGVLDRGVLNTVEAINRLTGIAWVDHVNHGVRPVLAVVSITMLVLECFGLVTPTTLFQDLAQAVLGLYVGGRISNTGR